MAKLPKEYISLINNRLIVVRPEALKSASGKPLPAVNLRIILPIPKGAR